MKYFRDLYNINDLFMQIGTLTVVVINLSESALLSKINQRNLSGFILLSMGLKAVIDWLRLFDVTSFYVTLITRTVYDIAYFGLILCVMILFIGSATYMLQLNADESEEASIIAPYFDNFIVDSILNQYLLILGEFHMDGFETHIHPALCFTFFFVTTFIMQITFLNMLIAIMGDTFDRVIEQRPTFSLKNKLMILAGMENIIRTNETVDDTKIFLYVIQPVTNVENDGSLDGDSENWRGKVFYTHSLIKLKATELREELENVASEQRIKTDEISA